MTQLWIPLREDYEYPLLGIEKVRLCRLVAAPNMNNRIFCPKCQSRDIEMMRLSSTPEPRDVSMDELTDGFWGEHSTVGEDRLITSLWSATCSGCGYRVEYHRV